MDHKTNNAKMIRVVAPARPLGEALADRLQTIVAQRYANTLTIRFDEQCFLHANHFAGTDSERRNALVGAANDPDTDIIWFARGGYGALRLFPEIFELLDPNAARKIYVGYSDMGFLLGGLYKRGIGTCVHAPMIGDLARAGGEEAVIRVLDFLKNGYTDDPACYHGTEPVAAFNLTVLAGLAAAGEAPDLAGHVLMLEDIGEYHYRLDRAMAMLFARGILSRLAGLRAGRFSAIPLDESDVAFGMSSEEIMRHWCARANISYLGSCDIGHDIDNKIIVFGSQD